MTFPCMELFSDFRFPMIFKACGKPVDRPLTAMTNYKRSFLTELTIFKTKEIVSLCYSATMQTKFSRHPEAFGPRSYSRC